MNIALNIFNGIVSIGCLLSSIYSIYEKDKKMVIINFILFVLNAICVFVL